jgi:hypothetical protein
VARIFQSFLYLDSLLLIKLSAPGFSLFPFDVCLIFGQELRTDGFVIGTFLPVILLCRTIKPAVGDFWPDPSLLFVLKRPSTLNVPSANPFWPVQGIGLAG